MPPGVPGERARHACAAACRPRVRAGGVAGRAGRAGRAGFAERARRACVRAGRTCVRAGVRAGAHVCLRRGARPGSSGLDLPIFWQSINWGAIASIARATAWPNETGAEANTINKSACGV